MMKYLSWFVLIGCLSSACSSQSVYTGDSVIIQSGVQPALHAVQDRELRDLMDRMNALMMERYMTEQEMDVQRARFADRIVEASGLLAGTADRLVSKLPELGLNDQEASAFRILADKLRQQATLLAKQAENRSYNAISRTLHEMTSTCMACHTLFRKS
ncbi:MAG: hypothetical protein ACU836_00835 [Gammaproteobacteria bacterium]